MARVFTVEQLAPARRWVEGFRDIPDHGDRMRTIHYDLRRLGALAPLQSLLTPGDWKRLVAADNHQALKQLLVRSKPPIESLTPTKGESLLAWARSYMAAEWLMARGVDPNFVDGQGRLAIHYNHNSLAGDVLLKATANLDHQDSFGMTALHYAAHNGIFWSVNALLAHGANPWTKDNDGKTPRDLAQHKLDTAPLNTRKEEGYTETCRVLKEGEAAHVERTRAAVLKRRKVSQPRAGRRPGL